MCKVFSYLSWFVVNFLILISSFAGKLVMPVVNTCSECTAYQHGNQPILWTFLFMSFRYKIVLEKEKTCTLSTE